MPTQANRIHVVIVNFRTPELTAGAIDSVLGSSVPGYDVRLWLVDNGSGDDSVACLRHRYADLRIIESPENLGFAGGNNLALRQILTSPEEHRYARSYVLLLNSDVVVEPDAIITCLRYLETHPDVAVVGPRVTLPDGRLDLACRRGFPTPQNAFWKLTGLSRRFPDNERFSGYNLTHLDEHATAEVDAVSGAFMLVRLPVVHRVGLLDERFFMYGEDLDWAYRIKAHGWKVVYHPLARVTHLKSASARRQSRRMIYEFYRAMWLFHRKHYSSRTFFVVNWLVMIGIVSRGLLALTVNAFRPTERKRFA